MRKVLFILVLTLAGLFPLLRYHTAATEAAQSAPAPGTAAPPSATAPPDPGAPSSGVPSSSAPSSAGGPPSARIVDGSKVDTDFGPYQVRATFSAGRIIDVQMITEPSDRRSRRIAAMAASALRTEALQAQSAHIDTVSGATQTSEAYAQSLQAAIDAKGN
jgi:uncharacterized protein with FMN-binding domain